jgi:hypothetical protein
VAFEETVGLCERPRTLWRLSGLASEDFAKKVGPCNKNLVKEIGLCSGCQDESRTLP